MARWNPFSFTPGPVIFFTSAVYVALFASLLIVHLRVPDYPSKPPTGINLTQAWGDLQHITRRFHPYNSHENDNVRAFLLSRIRDITKSKSLNQDQVTVIDDNISNATFAEGKTSIYFEGTNIIVAIRGSDDDEPIPSSVDSSPAERRPNNPAVLVNAHYDSVSSGYGATDDGVGVVSVLQLLSYFTESRNWPRRTVVLLINNGEEDFLNGAKAFMRHPISQIVHTFVNLEGAGAGGRATLFRSTDAEVTRFYKAAKHPFGTVVSSDGFKKHLIRSETDYKVFYEELGLRGLDIAFMEPRARYHTVEDSTRETSLNSVWHMLSAAIATTSGLASDTSAQFSENDDEHRVDDGKVHTGAGNDAVWFDIFGKVFLVFRLHTMFALCVTLLVVAPLILIGLTIILSKLDKNYLFARKAFVHSEDDDQPIHLNGWRGFFRFPIIFVAASAVVVGLALLVVRINPFIVYSSPFAVWSMMFSAWFSIAWFLSRGADAMRPSALQRMYSLLWLFVGAFVILTVVTVLANNYQIAGGYFGMFYFAGVFVALALSYLEMFFLPTKKALAAEMEQANDARRNSQSASRPLTGSTSAARSDDRPVLDDDATETTSLLRGDRRSFARYGSGRDTASETGATHEEGPRRLDLKQPYPGEQEWSGKLPSWIWILQLLLVAPIVIILVGQLGLLVTSALYQTPADGSSSLFIYISFAAVTVLLIAPVGPFIHRFTYHVPTFVFLVCVGTVIYNLVAFPFSREHRLKIYFKQDIDCTTGSNTVTLTGLDGYIQRIVADLPSTQGKHVNCAVPPASKRKELRACAWEGLAPRVVPNTTHTKDTDLSTSKKAYTDGWLDYSIKMGNKTNKAVFRVAGQNTRACRIVFIDSPISDLAVGGAVSDSRFNAVGAKGSREVRLWHREWSKPWDVSVTWNTKDDSKHSGKVVCLWSDANTGDIPAFDEVQHFLPVWAIPTKLGDGLVEGFKDFQI